MQPILPPSLAFRSPRRPPKCPRPDAPPVCATRYHKKCFPTSSWSSIDARSSHGSLPLCPCRKIQPRRPTCYPLDTVLGGATAGIAYLAASSSKGYRHGTGTIWHSCRQHGVWRVAWTSRSRTACSLAAALLPGSINVIQRPLRSV